MHIVSIVGKDSIIYMGTKIKGILLGIACCIISFLFVFVIVVIVSEELLHIDVNDFSQTTDVLVFLGCAVYAVCASIIVSKAYIKSREKTK